MSCDITKGKIALACKNAVSGLKAIYIANYADYGFLTSSTPTGQIMTDLGALDVVYKYELKNTGNTFEQDWTSSRDNGTTVFTQKINFILTKISKEMEFQLKMMVWGRPQIFVEDNAGDFFLLGKENGCEITGKSTVGGTMESLNGYTMTGTAMEKEPIFYLDAPTVTNLKALISNDNIL